MRSQNIFLVNSDKASTDIAAIFGRLLKTKFSENVAGIERIHGGINGEAYKILTDHYNEYFGKIYRIRKGDSRNRLATEFSGLTFLWQNGVKNIPEPLLASEEDGMAIYRFIKGSKIKPGEITAADIDEAADFATQVHSLASLDYAENQPIASEACFSIREYIDCVHGRVGKLKKVIKKDAISAPLGVFLEGEFMPFFDGVKKETERKAEKFGIDIDEKLHKSKRTLSVSDFGFHNAIRSDNDQLFFFDFEYYGWDDPAKMIADFYLQPAVPVPLSYRERFFGELRKNYREGNSLNRRISIIYPILGLKWCLIMLNTFLHIDDYKNGKAVCLEHLAKAVNKFEEIRYEIDANVFPISLT